MADQDNTPVQETELLEPNFGARPREQALDSDLDSENPEGSSPFDSMDEGMMAQVQEMMGKLQRADDLERELADLKGRYNRLLTDFEGYRNRTTLEAREAESKGVSKAAETLFPVMDDLARAIEFARKNPEAVAGSLETVQTKMTRLFGELGLEQTGAVGEVFDPAFHEALQVVSGEQDDRIVEVFQSGFKLGERLIRPARVVVSKASN